MKGSLLVPTMSFRSYATVVGNTMSACLAVAVHQGSLTMMVSGTAHALRRRFKS
ncbi:hypothetical protein D3C87_1549620 [compost metagenome]